MKTLKKASLILVTVCALVLCTVLCAVNASAAGVKASGKCGDNLTWVLYDDGELVIDGEGEMWDFMHGNPAPSWRGISADIKSVTIEDGVTTIGDGAFHYCTNLTNITVDKNNPNYCDLDGVLFTKDRSILIKYPSGKDAVEYTVPKSVTSISDWSFMDCTSLESVTISEGVTSIGYLAFYNCTNLTSITLPESLSSIGDEAFWFCTSLESVTIPEGVTYIGSDAFHYCTNLTNITVDKNNPNYCDLDGVWFTKDRSILIRYPIGKDVAEYTVPEGVTSIGNHAFYYCTNLTSVTILEGVTSIDTYAFSHCMSLTSITLPESLSSIGNCAFALCMSLESVTIPEGVTSIGNWAFGSCTSLESVTIPEGVTSIGYHAFSDCGSLSDVTVLSRDVVFGFYVFSFSSIKFTLYGYRSSTTEAYAETYNHNFVALDEEPEPEPDPTPDLPYLLGDINMDGSVDIRDAVLLFQHSMLPETFPVSYPGGMDFTGDGNVDINDAMYLFQHSMLPDMFPLKQN